MIASVPPTDHGWLGAISKNAKAEAEKYDDLDFQLLQAADADSQAQQVEQAIAQKPDVLVVLPQDGAAALTPVAQKAEKAGHPGREHRPAVHGTGRRDGDRARRQHQTAILAADYISEQLKCEGNVVEIQGLAGISVTEDRTKGFTDELKKKCPGGGIEIVASQPGDFNPDQGLKVMENILQAEDKIDAVYTHDDALHRAWSRPSATPAATTTCSSRASAAPRMRWSRSSRAASTRRRSSTTRTWRSP